ncbi:glycosyltransferase [Limosilactobacillus agrestis]|uniref:Glycosyltransferase n=1 Tax=Limosilactobacillus agrestis TaxID=2759748 RepID=A0A7W3YM14_9LACO|nr:glycosyltransferase [Limosilactobacillus agrestis]MBB1096001.1 glycosyltransferase [Limosilactobacillus agrestis]MCD7131315.1 glycosyltransferase [Limosilactobacillus agrestis]
MLFFLNDNLQRNKSGIEHAQIKRLHLFEKYHQPAKIVTRQYSNELHLVTEEAGIDDHNFVNLFDYFQEACEVPQKDIQIKDIPVNPHWRRKAEGINYNYYQNGQRVLYIRRRSNNDRRVINLQYFDHFGKLLKVSWFDSRGFISVEQLYDWEGKIATENYYRPDGSIAIQLAHQKNKRGKEIKTYHLFNYHGHDYHFSNFEQLTRFFLDELVTDKQICGEGPVGLVVDRVYELGWAVLNMHHRVFRVLQLHNDHVNNPADMLHSSLNYNYDWGLKHLQNWDGVITLTPQQQRDVYDRFGKLGVKIYRIPGPIVPAVVIDKPHVPFNQRTKNQVVMVARLSPEKQQDHLLKAWPQVLKAIPTAKLDFWGYTNDGFDKTLKQLVKDEQLNRSVTFHGYTEDVNTVYEDAQLLILPSRAEGLPLSLVEAQSHGLPIVANDIKYGPSDVIIDQQDGILTQNGDIDGLARAIISLLGDQERLAKMSANAYEDSKRYSEPSVMKLWTELVNDMQAKGTK